jgi:uncharacterized membrane protein
MSLLIAGVVIFFGMHLVSACTRCRESLVARIGENGYRGVYVAGSVVGFLLIVAGTAFVDFVPVYEPPAWGRQATLVLMPVAFVMLAALLLPTNIKRFIRHPMLWSFTIWSIAHLLANGDLGSTLLFGSFGLYSLFSMWSLNRRGAVKADTIYPFTRDALVIVVGAVAYVVVVYLHPYMFGVPAIA